MNKNTSVETAQKSQATTTIDKTPTGKVKTLKTAEQRRKEREEQFKNFRINSLKRRCKRMKMSDEDTEKYVKALIEQMKEPANYSILMFFNKENIGMVKQALLKAKIDLRIIGDYYAWVDGDSALLAKLREILPPKTKIHPYVKKKPPILEKREPDKKKKPTVNTKTVKKDAKLRRKSRNLAVLKARKSKKGKIMTMVHKKPSNSLKKASKDLKKAA